MLDAGAVSHGRAPSAEAVAIPGVILTFLERASFALAGTRTADLVPHFHRVTGWRVGPDRRTMTVLVSEGFTEHLLDSLEDNGEIALAIEEIGPHETYQFKGRFLDSRPPDDEEDRHAFERNRERYVRVVHSMYGFPEEAVRAYFRRPAVAVRFEVREIFLQTPGPGAGRRLVPPERA
jgi:hypothetical protein